MARLLFAVLWLFVVGGAQADTVPMQPGTSLYEITSACFGNAGSGNCSYGSLSFDVRAASSAEACQAVPTPSSGFGGGAWKLVGTSGNACVFRSYSAGDPNCNSACGAGTAVWTVVQTPSTCPINSSADPNGSTCTCNSGTSAGHLGQCYQPTSCTAGQVSSSGYYSVGGDPNALPAAGCVQGCAASFQGVGAPIMGMNGGKQEYSIQGQYVASGDKCGSGAGDPTNAPAPPSPVSQNSPPASTCGAGEALGEVSGKPYCAPVGAKSPTDPSTTPATGQAPTPTDSTSCSNTSTSNADGSVTASQVCTTKYADGSTGSTTTNTTTKGGVVTGTTSTSTGANTQGGSPSGSSAAGGSGSSDACRANPSASGCGGQGAPIGSLYTKGSATVGGVLQEGRDALMQTPIGAATTGFWNVQASGACPIWTWSIDYFQRTYVLDLFCSSWMSSALGVMRVCVLIVFAWAAFRICLD